MNKATTYFVYLTLLLLNLGMMLGMADRYADPFWGGNMRSVRYQYDALAMVVAIYSLIAAIGFHRRRAWALAQVICLAVVLVFVGALLPVFALWYSAASVQAVFENIPIGLQEIVIGLLGSGCILLLSRRDFRRWYVS